MAKGKNAKTVEGGFQILTKIPLNKLHFDPENPRRDPMEDEAEIRLVLCQEEGVLRLASHIAKHGQNPLDRMAVLAHPQLPGHYVVPEGNRRLCAMQLLRDPERAPTPAARKYFERLNADGRPVPEELEAVLFADEESARVWMSVKHEGEQGGIGTVEWGTKEKARFNGTGARDSTRPRNPNIQALALVEYAVARGLLTKEERALINLSTVTRYLPSVRAALALLNKDDVTTNADLDQFDAGVQKFLRDALPTGDAREPQVHSRSKSTDWQTYAEKLREDGFAPTDRSLEPYNPAAAPKSAPAVKERRPRSVMNPDLRKFLIPASFAVPVKDSVLLRMVKEGKELEVQNTPFSSNYLIRAILERVVHLYAKKHGVGIVRELETVISRVVDHAVRQQDKPTRGIESVLRSAASNKHAAYAPNTLGNGVHGGRIPTPTDNKSNWESLQPSLEYLMAQLK